MNPEEILKLKGWDFFDADKQQELRGRSAAKAQELDVLAFNTFSTTAGQKFLKWMVQQTVLRSTGGDNATQRGAGIREGQNDLVRQILAMIERSKKEPRT